MGLLLLVASVIAGIGMVTRLFPFSDGAERFFWGIALGTVSTSWLGYVLARLFGSLSHGLALLLTVAICMMAVIVVLRDTRWPGFDLAVQRFKGELWLICATLPFALILGAFCYRGMFHSVEGIWQLTLTSWYDMALHLALATSFAFGQNFPPQYLLLPNEPLHYPPLPDFHAGILLKLGTHTWPAFAMSSFLMGLSLIGGFFCFARRLLASQAASAVATVLFFLNGGFGFLLYFRDARASHASLWSYLFNMKANYTDYWDEGIKWANIISSGVVPQRAMLYGMPVGLVVLTLFAIQWRRWSESTSRQGGSPAALLLPAGVITGLLPLVHVHSYFAIGFVSCGLFLLRPRIAWISFWLPAVLLAVPSLLDIRSHLHSEKAMHYHLGWMSYLGGTNFSLFLIRNFGLPLLLIVPAVVKAQPPSLRTFFLPFGALIVFCFFVVVAPNDFDNLKLMYYGYTVAAVVLAGWLCRIGSGAAARTVAVVAVAISTASGALAIAREIQLTHGIFVPQELEAGYFARKKLPAKAVFLTGQYHNQPVLCLAGKPLVLGYEFWVSSHGYPRAQYDAILEDVKAMYRGGAQSLALLDQYHVSYIYVGPKERAELEPNEKEFGQRYAVAFRNSDITIYDARRSAAQ